MTAIWALTAQVIMISLGYCAACLAGGAFATIVVLDLGLADLPADWPRLVELTGFWITTAATAFVGAFWPTVVAAAITEGLKLRGVVVYLVAGCIVGLVSALPVGAVMLRELLPPVDASAVQLTVACGAIGGFVYWAIAGRTAGRWLELRWFEENRR